MDGIEAVDRAVLERKAKAMIKAQVDPKVIAEKTGLSQMWIELQYLGGKRNG